MAILNVKPDSIGQAGVSPSFIYIDTTNTIAEVLSAGFLNNIKAEGAPISQSQMALVTTRTSPSSKLIQTNLFDITYSGGNWSLALRTNDAEVAFSPTVTFETAGDLTVSYTTRIGFYYRVGNLIFMRARVGFTPTYTTSSGRLFIENPLTVANNGTLGGSIIVQTGTSLVFPAGTSQIVAVPFTVLDIIGLRGIGDGVVSDLGTTEFPTGVARDFTVYVTFKAA